MDYPKRLPKTAAESARVYYSAIGKSLLDPTPLFDVEYFDM
jgi:hypothetical protein